MKKRLVWLISATLLLPILVSIISGCSWFTVENPVKTMILVVPEGTSSCQFWDLEALRNDKELGAVYQKWRDSWTSWLDGYGIYYGDVDRFAKVDGTTLTIIGGSIDKGDIRKKLMDKQYTEGKYLRQERWENAGLDQWVVITQEFILIGQSADVKPSVDVFKGEEGKSDSLMDDARVQGIVAKLPVGLKTMVGRTTPLTSAVTAWGYAWESAGQSTLKLTAVYLFDGLWAIDGAKPAIEDYWESHDHYDIKASQSGEYLQITGSIDATDFEKLVGSPS